MHRVVEHKTTVSSRRFTIRGSLLYLIFYRLVNMIIVSASPRLSLAARQKHERHDYQYDGIYARSERKAALACNADEYVIDNFKEPLERAVQNVGEYGKKRKCEYPRCFKQNRFADPVIPRKSRKPDKKDQYKQRIQYTVQKHLPEHFVGITEAATVSDKAEERNHIHVFGTA